MQHTTTRGGAAPIRPEDLLAHSAWLRRLAGTLVRGDADADDLVQETWLAAIKSPPLDDRPVRGWLREVARNAWRMRARTEGRRERREAEGLAVGEPSTPSADELLTRLAAQRRLSALVTELPEPFRTTVLLRYFEGLSAAEIARRLRAPEGTVRWRLKTGLDRLRSALDRENGGDRARWCLLLGPLADPGGGVSTMLKSILSGIVKSFVKTVLGLSHAAKLLLAAIVAVAGVGGWLRFGPHPGSETATVAVAKAREAGPSRTRRAAVEPSGAARLTVPDAQVERDDTAVHGAFEGRVVNWSTGHGVPGAEVTFSIDGATSATNADEDGHFALAPQRSGRSTLAMVTAPGFLPFAPDWGHSPFELWARPGLRVRDVTVQLVPALDYVGVVLDTDGKPVEGVTVTLLGAGQGERSLHPIEDHFVSDARGEFHFHAPDDAVLEARHPVHGVARGRMAGAALVSHRLTLKLAQGDGALHLGTEHISGRVVDAEGAPVAGALVYAHPLDMGEWSTSTSGQATTDASGRFTVEGLDPGRHSLMAQHTGYASTTLDPVPAGATEVLLDLRRGGSLSGRVLEAEGSAPVPSFNVIVARRDGPVKEISVASRAVVDAEGRFTVPDLGPGEYRVRATAYGHAPSPPLDVTLAGASGGPVEIRLGRGGKLVGKLIETVGGAPIEGARISLESQLDSSTAAPAVVNALTNADGDFELDGVPPGVRSVNIGAYQHDMRIIAGLHFDEGVTTGPLVFDLPRTPAGEEPHTELAGIGAQLRAEGDGLRIEKLYAGSGALDVGLAPGDTLLAIDGTPIASLGMDDSIQRIRGPEGSSVRLAVRKADGTVIEVVAARRRIQT
jgi:RNA polymerase sigma factor (sigma-70 family)